MKTIVIVFGLLLLGAMPANADGSSRAQESHSEAIREVAFGLGIRHECLDYEVEGETLEKAINHGVGLLIADGMTEEDAHTVMERLNRGLAEQSRLDVDESWCLTMFDAFPID